MKRFQFRLLDLIWLAVVVSLSAAWWLDRSTQTKTENHLRLEWNKETQARRFWQGENARLRDRARALEQQARQPRYATD